MYGNSNREIIITRKNGKKIVCEWCFVSYTREMSIPISLFIFSFFLLIHFGIATKLIQQQTKKINTIKYANTQIFWIYTMYSTFVYLFCVYISISDKFICIFRFFFISFSISIPLYSLLAVLSFFFLLLLFMINFHPFWNIRFIW